MSEYEPDFYLGCDREACDIDDLPRGRDERAVGYVYVFEMDNGVVKVGRTTKAQERIRNHIGTAQAHSVKILRCWVSDPTSVGQSVATESRVVSWASTAARGVISNEYFKQLDFDAAVTRCIDSIDDDQAPVSLATMSARHHMDWNEALRLLGLSEDYNGDRFKLGRCLRDTYGLPFKSKSTLGMTGREFTEFVIAAASRYVAAAASLTPNSADRLNGIKPPKSADLVLREGV